MTKDKYVPVRGIKQHSREDVSAKKQYEARFEDLASKPVGATVTIGDQTFTKESADFWVGPSKTSRFTHMQIRTFQEHAAKEAAKQAKKKKPDYEPSAQIKREALEAKTKPKAHAQERLAMKESRLAREAKDKKTEAKHYANAAAAADSAAHWHRVMGNKDVGNDYEKKSLAYQKKADQARAGVKGEAKKPAGTNEAWKQSDLATSPNISEGRVAAKKQAGGKYKLFYRGTRNEVFQGELFDSASGARKFFKVQKMKAQQATKSEQIPGGLAEGKKPGDFDQEQLKMGIKVEMEHTPDKAKAREIAMDHLVEDSKYYTHLKEMEEKYAKKSGVDALDDFAKGGPFIGPRGGWWKDPQHKIPWGEGKGGKTSGSDSGQGKRMSPGNVLDAIGEAIVFRQRADAGIKQEGKPYPGFSKTADDAVNSLKEASTESLVAGKKRAELVLRGLNKKTWERPQIVPESLWEPPPVTLGKGIELLESILKERKAGSGATEKSAYDALDDFAKGQPSATANLTPEKARQILHDGTVHGHPITEQQRKFFGAIGGHLPAPGKKKSAQEPESPEEEERMEAEKEKRDPGKPPPLKKSAVDHFSKGGPFKYKRKKLVGGKWVYEYEDPKGKTVEAPEKGTPEELLMKKYGPKIKKMLKEHMDAIRQDQADNQARVDKRGDTSVFGPLLGPTPRADAVKKKYGKLWEAWERAKALETAMLDKSFQKADDGKPGESLGETSTEELQQTHKDIMARLKGDPKDAAALQARRDAIAGELKRRAEKGCDTPGMKIRSGGQGRGMGVGGGQGPLGKCGMKKSGLDLLDDFAKALFIGPKGGRWADAKHTIPYDEKKHGKGAKKNHSDPGRAGVHRAFDDMISANIGRSALRGVLSDSSVERIMDVVAASRGGQRLPAGKVNAALKDLRRVKEQLIRNNLPGGGRVMPAVSVRDAVQAFIARVSMAATNKVLSTSAQRKADKAAGKPKFNQEEFGKLNYELTRAQNKGDTAAAKTIAKKLIAMTKDIKQYAPYQPNLEEVARTGKFDPDAPVGGAVTEGSKVTYQGYTGTVTGTRGDTTMVDFGVGGGHSEAIITERLKPLPAESERTKAAQRGPSKQVATELARREGMTVKDMIAALQAGDYSTAKLQMLEGIGYTLGRNKDGSPKSGTEGVGGRLLVDAARQIQQDRRTFKPVGKTASGKDIPDANDPVYQDRTKMPKWNRDPSALEEPKLLRQRFGHFSKQDHLDAAKIHADERDRLDAEHSRAYKDAVAKHGPAKGAGISGGAETHFPDETKTHLRELAHAATRASKASAAHYQASGKRKHYSQSEFAKKSQNLTDWLEDHDMLRKAEGGGGGPFIGPRGGEWKDPAHTIPWKDDSAKEGSGKKATLTAGDLVVGDTLTHAKTGAKVKIKNVTLLTYGKGKSPGLQVTVQRTDGGGATSVMRLKPGSKMSDWKRSDKKETKTAKSLSGWMEDHDMLQKAEGGGGGPFIGPRGGKWADAKMTIPWSEKRAQAGKKQKKPREEAEEGTVRELTLFVENDADLHRQMFIPAVKNLVNKMASGKYDHAQATKLFNYMATEGAKRYTKEHGTSGAKIFSPADRMAAAKELADYFHDEAKLGNYDQYLNKKNKKAVGSLEERGGKTKKQAVAEAQADDAEKDAARKKEKPEGGGAVTDEKSAREFVASKVGEKIQSIKKQIAGLDLEDRSQAVKLYGTLFGEASKAVYGSKEGKEYLGNYNDNRIGTMLIDIIRKELPEVIPAFEKHKIDKRKWVKKSEVDVMSGIDTLASYAQEDNMAEELEKAYQGEHDDLDDDELEKAQAMPQGNPKQKLGQGEEQGGKVAGVGMTSGSSDSAPGPGQDKSGQVTGTSTAKDKLSEDDEDDEGQMKPHKKPIETARKSMAIPGNQRDMVAKETAQYVALLRKGDKDMVLMGTGLPEQAAEVELEKAREGVQGMVHYSDRSDIEAAHLVKSEDFYSGGAPQVLPFSRPIGSGQVCLNCQTHLSKSLTACPNCGAGTVTHQVLPGGEAQGDHDGEPIVKSQAGKLRPKRFEDVKIK